MKKPQLGTTNWSDLKKKTPGFVLILGTFCALPGKLRKGKEGLVGLREESPLDDLGCVCVFVGVFLTDLYYHGKSPHFFHHHF